MPKKYWLSPDELAEELGVPLATVYKWRYEGTGPKGYKIGKHIRFERADVDRWLEARADTPRPVA